MIDLDRFIENRFILNTSTENECYYVNLEELKNMLIEFATLMCEKQREMCAKEGKKHGEISNEDEYYILNTSCPEELQ